MAPATIQLIFGILEISLRLMCVLMAAAALFLFALHRFATKSARVSFRESEQRSLSEQDFKQNPSFVRRFERSSNRRSNVRFPG